MMWWRPEPFVAGGSGRAHLKVQGLSAGYGAFLVLRDLSLEARPGLTVILGPNGAGKTTLLRALAGLIPRRGWVTLDGDELSEKTHEIVRAGVALVAEGRQLFPQMTVTENLELGGWLIRARRPPRGGGDPRGDFANWPSQIGSARRPSARAGSSGPSPTFRSCASARSSSPAR